MQQAAVNTNKKQQKQGQTTALSIQCHHSQLSGTPETAYTMSFQPAQASTSTSGDASLGTAATGTTSSVSDSMEYVTLVSNDGFEFVIPREAACVSGTIRRMLENGSECRI